MVNGSPRWTHVEVFPEESVILQHEIMQNHPHLQTLLSRMPQTSTLNERVAVIATYCGVIVDGFYGEDQLAGLFQLLIDKLRARGTIHLLRPMH